jgi:hypothetical protein
MAAIFWRLMSLHYLLNEIGDRLSARQYRLLACAAVRRLALPAKGSAMDAVALAERFSDGWASSLELASARYTGRFQPNHPAWAVCWNPNEDPRAMTERALAWVVGCVAGTRIEVAHREKGFQADLLREIAAPLFEPIAFNVRWRLWSDATIVRLAQGIYDERAFDQMPILGDALEEAGCADATILEHCRQSAGHVPGCWLLDLILNKK